MKNKSDYIKINNFCSSKGTSKSVKIKMEENELFLIVNRSNHHATSSCPF